MELDPQTLRSVWWKGAIGSALKGIPQGLMLGLLGASLLCGGIALLGSIGATSGIALGLAKAFGGFLYSSATAQALAAGTLSTVPAFGLATLNVLPIVALNTVLTSVGNFLTGGQIACNAYKQDVEHRMNHARIRQLEAREQVVEATLARTPSQAIQAVLTRGPRAQQSYEAAEAARSTSANGTILH